jgi:cell shape-determining protein MreC
MIDLNDFLTIIGLLFGLAVQAGAVVSWITKKIDAKHAEYHAEMLTINRRVDDVKDKYVKRVDLDRDLNRIYEMVAEVNKSIRGQNERLDKLLTAVVENRQEG